MQTRLPPRALTALTLGALLALGACGRHDAGGTTTGSASGDRSATMASNDRSPGGTTTGGSSGSTSSTTGSMSGTTAGTGSTGTGPTGSPGMTGAPTGSTSATNTANADLNTMPPTGAGTSQTGSGASADAAAGGQLAGEDRKFVMDAAAGGLFEVQVSKLAADKATDPAVKQFAQMLVTDHTNANEELKAFASAHNVTLPTTLPKEQQSQLDKLQKASGKDFDKQYAQMVGMKDHKDDISKFEKASKDVKNPDLKAWVDKTLPTLKEHLAAAQKLPENGGKG